MCLKLCEFNLCKGCLDITELDYCSSVHALFCNTIVQLIASPKGLGKYTTHTWKTVCCQYVGMLSPLGVTQTRSTSNLGLYIEDV